MNGIRRERWDEKQLPRVQIQRKLESRINSFQVTMEIMRKHFSSLETDFLLNDLLNNCRYYGLSKMRCIYPVYPMKRELWQNIVEDYRITRKKKEKRSKEKKIIRRKKTRNIIKCILLMIPLVFEIDSFTSYFKQYGAAFRESRSIDPFF